VAPQEGATVSPPLDGDLRSPDPHPLLAPFARAHATPLAEPYQRQPPLASGSEPRQASAGATPEFELRAYEASDREVRRLIRHGALRKPGLACFLGRVRIDAGRMHLRWMTRSL
jgi:hypothetical protein